jgi:hypothetical protein
MLQLVMLLKDLRSVKLKSSALWESEWLLATAVI